MAAADAADFLFFLVKYKITNVLDLCMDFNNKVYQLTKKIPKGKVSTYKDIAEKMGTRAYRAVGRALRCNPYAPFVPCHRVVKSDGTIGGFMGKIKGKELDKKVGLLKKEGIFVKENKILDFKKKLYKF